MFLYYMYFPKKRNTVPPNSQASLRNINDNLSFRQALRESGIFIAYCFIIDII